MKRVFISLLLIGSCLLSFANDIVAIDSTEVKTEVASEEKKEIVKTGYNFGPFPVVAFDADKGFGVGALCNIFNFGDGSTYPNPKQQWYLEGSYYTKGTQMYIVSFDAKDLIPKVRTSISALVIYDNALPFVGFNGYESFYDWERMAAGNDKNSNASMFNPYYRVSRLWANFKADFSGNITKDGKFKWIAGYHFSWDKYSEMNIDRFNKNLDDDKKYNPADPTLFNLYNQWGIIPDNQVEGGITSSIRAGLIFDSRDVENNPGKGIWTDGHIIAAPKFLGSTIPYYKYSLSFRHYIPLVYRKLTLAYRINYQGTIGKTAPFYSMPYTSVMGKGYDKDAIGGYRTVRGMMKHKLTALDQAFYNIDLRWKFIEFKLLKQNIAFALTAFTDGGITTRQYDMSFKSTQEDFASEADFIKSKQLYDEYIGKGDVNDKLHITAGGGIRFIMNENFILAAEMGVPIDKRDGNFSFYLNTGFLF